jgi:hypothetical protein
LQGDGPFGGGHQPVVAVVGVQAAGVVGGELLGGVAVGVARVAPVRAGRQAVAGGLVAVVGGLAVGDQLGAVAVRVVGVVGPLKGTDPFIAHRCAGL